MSVPFLDLTRQHRPLRAEIEAALLAVLDSGQFILGPQTEALEGAVADLCGVPHGVAAASGTDALLLILQALGIGNGHEVITTPFTFMATAGAIARTGAKPVFADIDPVTFNLDPAKTEAAITKRTAAILAVDLYGLCAEWEKLEKMAATRKILLVEDACQAIGARRGGRPAGSFGDAAAFSFYPTKNLGGMGDGGMITTRRDDVATRARLLRAHGDAGGYDHREVGMNSRLDAFQAAVLRVKLRRLEGWCEERRRLAARYTAILLELFPFTGAKPEVWPPPPTPQGATHAYHQYVIRTRRRDELMAHLKAQGIGCAVYYPAPLHLQPCFASLNVRKGSLPEAERACAEVLALPLYPGLTEAEQAEVCRGIASFYGVKA